LPRNPGFACHGPGDHIFATARIFPLPATRPAGSVLAAPPTGGHAASPAAEALSPFVTGFPKGLTADFGDERSLGKIWTRLWFAQIRAHPRIKSSLGNPAERRAA
jgi:hypothetical protein